ncbi:MAG: CRISPR-associated protein Cas4 [Nanoarchaeota archaeon]
MLSVTMLSGYMYCPRKLYLERVLGLYEPPKEALVRGSIRHETYDLINKNEERIVKSIESPEGIKEIFSYEYQKFLRLAILKNKDGLRKFDLQLGQVFKETLPLLMAEVVNRSINISNFIKEHNIFGVELWEKLTPKIKSEFRVTSEKLGIKGIIDQIEVYETGMVPIELKTGKAPKEGVWPGHKIQIAAYALLLEEFNNKEVKEGFVTYLDTQERRHIPINAFLRLEVQELIDKVNDLLHSRDLPDYCASENKCNVCGLKNDCYNKLKMDKLLKSKPLNIS